MKYKIVSDSSCDIDRLDGVAFSKVPMKVFTAENQYTDDDELNIPVMLDELASFKGRSYTSCPNIEDWLASFEDADRIFAVTITSALSGSFNTASAAAKAYEEAESSKKVFVIDTLSAGPEMALILDKLNELIMKNYEFEQICSEITEYTKRTHLLFALASYHNFIQNGRVNKLAAMAAGTLGIRIVGVASEAGMLELLTKNKGENKTIVAIVKEMILRGFKGGKAYIGHVLNETGAIILKNTILKYHPDSEIKIYPMKGLCSYYAEKGGLLIGFEGNTAIKA